MKLEQMLGEAEKKPWDGKMPEEKKKGKLSDAQKSAARQRAKKAGRRYPNMVDNMWASRNV